MAKELVKKGKKTVVVSSDVKPDAETAIKPAETIKTEQPKAEVKAEVKAKENEKLLEERVLGQMKLLAANGIKEFTSTVLRDKLNLDKENGRDIIRKVMKRLKKDGKIITGEKTVGKLKRYVYSLKE